eukprot:gene3868-4840_t
MKRIDLMPGALAYDPIRLGCENYFTSFLLVLLFIRFHSGFAEVPKAYVFRGDKDYLPQKVQDMLGVQPTRVGAVGAGPNGLPPGKQSAIGRFFLPAADCSFALEQILEDLQKDPWPSKQEDR